MSKNFHAVEWMRKARARIDEQDKNLSWQEKSKKTIQQLEKDKLWQQLKDRVVKLESYPTV